MVTGAERPVITGRRTVNVVRGQLKDFIGVVWVEWQDWWGEMWLEWWK